MQAKQFLKTELENLIKAFGGCTKCFGKGYSTYVEPGYSVSPDFLGDVKSTIKNPSRDISFCSCDRGNALKSEFQNFEKAVKYDERRKIISKYLTQTKEGK